MMLVQINKGDPPHQRMRKSFYQRRVLEALAQGKSPTYAAKEAGVSRAIAYRWRQRDPKFAAAWDEAVAEGIDQLEDEAHRRAVEGVDRAVYQGGVRVGEIKTYSDSLLTLLLKSRRPEVFACSYDPSAHVDVRLHKIKTVQEALARFEQLGRPPPEFKGDYEEDDEPKQIIHQSR
jgi:hypothetical protein